MAKFNFHEEFNKRSIMSYLVPNVLGNRAKEVVEANGGDVENMDVKLTVNGIEFDAKEVLEQMWKIREEEIRECAKNIIDECMGSIVWEAQELAERMKAKIPWSEI